MTPKLSIIVPVYNVENYLSQCLDSLINQTLKEIEIICVNDGSTDNSQKVLEKYAKKDKRIKIIKKKNGGLSSARNAGMKEAKGEYIGFVDSDDWVDLSMYEKLYMKARRGNLDLAICSLNIYNEESGKTINSDSYYTLGSIKPFLDNKYFDVRAIEDVLFDLCVTAVDKIYRRSFVEGLNVRFPEDLHFEDNLFFFSLILSAKRIGIVRESLYYYRQARNEAITSKPSQKYFDILPIENEIIRIFEEKGCYRKFRDRLIGSKIYSIKYRFDMLEPKLQGEFFPLIKVDFASMKLSNYDLVKLPEEIRNFYLMVLVIDEYNPKSVSRSLWQEKLRFNKISSTFFMKAFKASLFFSSFFRGLLRDIYEIRFTGVGGLKNLGLSIVRAGKKLLSYLLRVISEFLQPVKFFIADHLGERTKDFLKKIIKLEFIKITRIVKNEKWKGPLVTVVTTFYNQSDTIMDTVDSVLNQYFNNFEYIIVNDGSKNEERKTLDTINDPRVTIIDLKENIGKGSPAAARNVGLKKAKGKYIMCLDGDDRLDPTYLEKFVTELETQPGIGIVTSNMKMFGAFEKDCLFGKFRPQRLFRQAIIHCASMFRAELLEKVPGFRSGIGYEDWEFWVGLVEAGANAKNIQDKVLIYRVQENSRYIEDSKKHQENFLKIVSFHRFYRLKVAFWQIKRLFFREIIDQKTAYINLGKENFTPIDGKKTHILAAIPWLGYGGAETLVRNVASSLSDNFEFTFMTGHFSDHQCEEDFKKISQRIYHLPYLFNEKKQYLNFINNYIKTRDVKVLHIFHNAFLASILPEIRRANPDLKIVMTMFNSKVRYFSKVIELKDYIDVFTSDNELATREMIAGNVPEKKAISIRSGLDIVGDFNPDDFDRKSLREEFGYDKDDLIVLFLGRLSPEKNPEYFLRVATETTKEKEIKYIVVGDGPQFSSLLKKYGALENVRFLGFVKENNKLFAVADIFMLPSFIEGSPQTIMEALAMGRIVLASPVGGVPELVADNKNGYYIDIDDPAKTAELIRQIRLGKRGNNIAFSARKTAEKDFGFEKMREGYQDLYGKLLGKGANETS